MARIVIERSFETPQSEADMKLHGARDGNQRPLNAPGGRNSGDLRADIRD